MIKTRSDLTAVYRDNAVAIRSDLLHLFFDPLGNLTSAFRDLKWKLNVEDKVGMSVSDNYTEIVKSGILADCLNRHTRNLLEMRYAFVIGNDGVEMYSALYVQLMAKSALEIVYRVVKKEYIV